MKKVISILVSVMMILTAIPAFADTAAAAPASVDVYEALDNFSAEELATTYTSETPFVDGNFVAPTGVNYAELLNAKVSNDEGGYVRVFRSDSEEQQIITAGAVVANPNLNIGIGEDQNHTFTVNMKLRNNSDDRNLWFYLVDANGGNKYQLFKFWSSNRLDININGSFANSNFSLADNVWYEITITVNIATGRAIVEVDGGNYNNVEKYYTNVKKGASGITYSGFRVGYDSGIDSSEYFDLAHIGISNNASATFEKGYDFEETTVGEHESGAWSDDVWSISQGDISTWGPSLSVIDSGDGHGKVLKATPPSSNYAMPFVCAVPSGTLTNDGVWIVEASYLEHEFGHIRIQLAGKNADGTAVTAYPFEFAGANWTYSCGENKNLSMSKEYFDHWRRVRVIFDMKNGTITLSHWIEDDPINTLVTVTDNTHLALTALKELSAVEFEIYTRFGGRYVLVDDLKVYEADTLRFIGSKNAVSVTADPTLFFNMPIKSTTATTSNVTLTDSEGNAVAGTVGISSQKNGISFYPSADLKGEETYTLTANCTVTDEFGKTLNLTKSINFTTLPLLTLVDFEFTSEEVVAGNLGATIEVKAEDKLPKNIYAALAIYNKSTGELVSINTGSINAVTNTFNLTATVPAEGTYYAKAFVWNTDANAVPYFTAQSIGLN